MYLLKENAKPVSINKKRRKIELLQLPGGPVAANNPPPEENNYMEMEDDGTENASAMKWPNKRGNRKNKET